MKSHPRVYTTIAFVAGVLLTLGFKDFYPDLERRFRRRRKASAGIILSAGPEPAIKFTSDDENHFQDGEVYDVNDLREKLAVIPEGIESCIGNTPLFKIKSLSNETGCEILAKAEVYELRPNVRLRSNTFLTYDELVPQWRRWKPQRSGSSENHRYGE